MNDLCDKDKLNKKHKNVFSNNPCLNNVKMFGIH